MIYNSIEEYAKTGYESHTALGFFDGVHLGHRAVIGSCTDEKNGCRAVVLTFSDSPARLLGKSDAPLITDNARKAQLLEELGADAVIFADFMRIRDMEAEEFVERVLCRALRTKKVSCGYNYRFGRNGAGDIHTLKKLCGERGITVSVCEPVMLDGQPASSTAVRERLLSGDVAGASRMLGSPYKICGTVGSGNRIGTGMGFPTVNLPIGEGLVVPRHGVYASRITVGNAVYRGATNIGVHPTVGANSVPVCETFLLDYRGGELYGRTIACEPVAFIRPERQFGSFEELREQIERDIEEISEIL